MAVADAFNKGIMVVDHEPGRLRLIASTLKKAGFVPLPVRSNEQALEVLDLLVPDLFIVNADVDGKCGSELCHEIRSAAKSPILLLGWQRSTLAETAALIDDFLAIPFVSYELVNKVEHLLDCVQPA